jgi:membrane protein DedA with SNARE-associated domain
MEAFSEFVLNYGYLLVAAWVFIDQLGVPIPANPVLVTAGALAGMGELNAGLLLASATLGSIPSDVIWYEAGRRKGARVLRLICRVSLEPDYCVRNTQDTFARYGPRSLFLAKFLPGYQTLAPPLAAMSGLSLPRFLAYDIPGAALWSATFIGIGMIFHGQLDRVFQAISELGAGLLWILAFGALCHVTWKFYHRRRFLQSLRTSRIEPHEVREMLDAGHDLALFDLRNELAVEMNPLRIPAAQLVTLEEIDERHLEIPRDREIILYCN